MVNLVVLYRFIKNLGPLEAELQEVRKIFKKTLLKACSNSERLATFASRLNETETN